MYKYIPQKYYRKDIAISCTLYLNVFEYDRTTELTFLFGLSFSEDFCLLRSRKALDLLNFAISVLISEFGNSGMLARSGKQAAACELQGSAGTVATADGRAGRGVSSLWKRNFSDSAKGPLPVCG